MRKIIVLLLGVIIVGCSQKPISEDEAIQIAQDDLDISEKGCAFSDYWKQQL